MNVLFLAPNYPKEMIDFVRGLSEVGARVIGVGETPQHALPVSCKRHLSAYVQVPSLLNAEALVAYLVPKLQGVTIDRVEGLWEPIVVHAAMLREAMGVPGMSVDVARGFRDKALMKARVQAAGLRVPHFARASNERQVREAVERIGYPVIIKPIDGAGSNDTHLLRADAELDAVLPTLRHVPEVSVEEYIEGEEFTYDTVCLNGEAVFENVAQYLPTPLVRRQHEWISPAQLIYRDPYQPALVDGVRLGRGVLRALGMDTGFTHMEWFRKASGEVVFGEIGARPGGGRLVDQINFANDFDVYREWARATCWGVYEGQPQRNYYSAIIYKRAIGRGHIQRIEGLNTLRRRCGSWLVHEELLPIGAPRRDWEQTLLGDGHVIVRHPDLEACRAMMNMAINDLKIYAG